MKKKSNVVLDIREGRSSPFRVRYYENGKRVNQSFKNRSDAEAFIASLNTVNSLPRNMGVAPRELLELLRFKDTCANLNIELSEGVDKACKMLRSSFCADKSPFTLAEALKKFLASRIKLKSRQPTIDEYEQYINSAIEYFGKDFSLSDITYNELLRFVMSRKTPSVREKLASKLRTIFKWLFIDGLVKENPALRLHIEKVKTDETPPEILTVEDAAKVIGSLPRDNSILACYALMMFAGLRPEEISAKDSSKRVLEWNDIKFETRKIVLSGSSSKVRKVRLLDTLPDNLWKFLELTPPEERVGRVCKYTYEQMRGVRKNIPVRLPKDVFRHCFASYGYYTFDPRKVITMMGHLRGFATFEKHYMGLTNQTEAIKYFGIMP